MDKPTKRNSSKHASHFARRLERVCIISLVLSMISQVNSFVAMPTYNSILASWGLFTVYSRKSRAVLGLIGFALLSLLLDIIFLSVWSNGDSDVLSRNDASQASTTTRFSVAMMILNMFTKTAVLYFGTHFFAILSFIDGNNIVEIPSPTSASSSSLKSPKSPSSPNVNATKERNQTPISEYKQSDEEKVAPESPPITVPSLNFNGQNTPPSSQTINQTNLGSERTDML